jgi:hypothetical protein
MQGQTSAAIARFEERAGLRQPVWHHDAACRGAPPEIFFDKGTAYGALTIEGAHRRRLAKTYCEECPVIQQCRDLYMAEEHGIFGGLDRDERRVYRRMFADGEIPEDPQVLRSQVLVLRGRGIGYAEIASMLGVGRSNLRAFMRVTDPMSAVGSNVEEPEDEDVPSGPRRKDEVGQRKQPAGAQAA